MTTPSQNFCACFIYITKYWYHTFTNYTNPILYNKLNSSLHCTKTIFPLTLPFTAFFILKLYYRNVLVVHYAKAEHVII